MPTMTSAPAVLSCCTTEIETCRACGGLWADPATRFLCPRCYTDGPTRSTFDSCGRRLADAPPVTTRPDDDIDEAPPADQAARPTRPDRPLTGEERRARDKADDEALLAAVDRLAAEGRYVTEDGMAASGLSAATRAAGLTPLRAEAAASRLVAAGVLLRVASRFYPESGRPPRGKLTAALRRVV